MARRPIRAGAGAGSADHLTDELATWDEVAERHQWRSILVGNGLSQNLWEGFGYNSLFELARGGDGAHLVDADTALFDSLGTRNFEAVLAALNTSRVVAATLGQPEEHLEEREVSIRNALVRAVHGVHVPWALVPEAHLDAICTNLRGYSAFYSTNYDLVTYWALMRDPDRFRDFFFDGQTFDPGNTAIRGAACAVHYLHGGLHLYRLPNGSTLKRLATPGHNLLDQFGTPYRGASPLFVSEGTAQDKLASIYRSDYLSFGFSRFEADDQPLVVFGHGLGESDRHIVRALDARPERPIAISVRPGGDVRQKKAALIAALPNAHLHFYDAATHPLGVQALRIEP